MSASHEVDCLPTFKTMAYISLVRQISKMICRSNFDEVTIITKGDVAIKQIVLSTLAKTKEIWVSTIFNRGSMSGPLLYYGMWITRYVRDKINQNTYAENDTDAVLPPQKPTRQNWLSYHSVSSKSQSPIVNPCIQQ